MQNSRNSRLRLRSKKGMKFSKMHNLGKCCLSRPIFFAGVFRGVKMCTWVACRGKRNNSEPPSRSVGICSTPRQRHIGWWYILQSDVSRRFWLCYLSLSFQCQWTTLSSDGILNGGLPGKNSSFFIGSVAGGRIA